METKDFLKDAKTELRALCCSYSDERANNLLDEIIIEDNNLSDKIEALDATIKRLSCLSFIGKQEIETVEAELKQTLGALLEVRTLKCELKKVISVK